MIIQETGEPLTRSHYPRLKLREPSLRGSGESECVRVWGREGGWGGEEERRSQYSPEYKINFTDMRRSNGHQGGALLRKLEKSSYKKT